MSNESVIQLLVVGTCLIVLFATMLVVSVWIQKRKQNMFHQEKERWQKDLIEERERTMNEISNDIHNHISQIVSFSQMMLKSALDADDRSEASEYINKVNTMLSGIGDDLQIMGKYLSSGFIKEWGLFRVVDRELEYIRSTYGISCHLEVEGEKQALGEETAILIYRIIQEAISNTLKHAKATEIEILFRYEQDKLHISITDNGIGLPGGKIPVTQGTGIKNMNERAKLLNGELNISSANKRGLNVSLSVDLAKMKQ